LVASYGRFSSVYPSLAGYLTSRSGTRDGNNPATAQPGFSASPSTLMLAGGQTAGTTILSWTAPPGVRYVQIRIGSPTGPAMTGIEGPAGSAQTGGWVTNGMAFFLQDASDGSSFGSSRTIATVRVQVATAAENGSEARRGTLSATPNPILVSAGQLAGRTRLTWQTSGVTGVQIRIGSPDGPAMTGIEAPNGSAETGDWVTDRMTFYLQDASDGSSSGRARTLAWIGVQTSR
jgi:hypothetical protein